MTTTASLALYQLRKLVDLLTPLHRPPPPPADDDWRVRPRDGDDHPGQTIDQFLPLWRFNQLAEERNTVYLNATEEVLGEFTQIFEASLSFVRAYYQIRANAGRSICVNQLPQEKRVNGRVETNAILSALLKGNLEVGGDPGSFAQVAITSVDLYSCDPGEWVFGESSMSDNAVAGVCVASLSRLGVGDERTPKRLALKRFIKVLLHEIGHVYKIRHEVHAHCLMCGMNHLEELDRTPFELCRSNLAKIMWASGLDPRKRAEDLVKLCVDYGFTEEAALYQKEVSLLKS